jgi:hypothetical protein
MFASTAPWIGTLTLPPVVCVAANANGTTEVDPLPKFKLPAIPAPPTTTKAPEVVEVEACDEAATILPLASTIRLAVISLGLTVPLPISNVLSVCGKNVPEALINQFGV